MKVTCRRFISCPGSFSEGCDPTCEAHLPLGQSTLEEIMDKLARLLEEKRDRDDIFIFTTPEARK